MVTFMALTYGVELATVITIGVALDNLIIFADSVPFDVQAKLPNPSVSRIYPMAPPPIFTFDTLPKLINPPGLTFDVPPLLTT